MSNKVIRLLCIDDDPLALDQIKAVLAKVKTPMQCEYFGSPTLALAAHRDNPADLVLSDLRLGAMTGLTLIAEMHSVAPSSVYMLLSGDADLESALFAMNNSCVFRFFTKPAVLDELDLGIEDAIAELGRQQSRNAVGAALEAVERMNIAVAAVDVTGKVVFANPLAERVFSESGFFEIGLDRQLRSVDPRQTAEFSTFLKDIARRDDGERTRRIFRFTHEARPTPIVLSVVYNHRCDDHVSHFSVVISDSSRKGVTTVDGIATALNITPSEARVVHGLVDGGSVDAAAVIAGVSVSTARTYLKHVFSKTGVSRQAELVRLALLAAA